MSQVLQCTQLAKLIFSFLRAARSLSPFHKLRRDKNTGKDCRIPRRTSSTQMLGVEHVQVARLIVVVAGAGVIDVGQPIEGQFAVALEALFGVRCGLRAIELSGSACSPLRRASDR